MDSRLLLPPFGSPLRVVEGMPRPGFFVPQIQIIFPAGLMLERRWQFQDGTVAAYWKTCTGAVVSVPPAAIACEWRPIGVLHVVEPQPGGTPGPNQCSRGRSGRGWTPRVVG